MFSNLSFDNLTVGMDAKRAIANNTGLGNYSRLVIDVLSDDPTADRRLRLYVPDPHRRNERLEPLLRRPGVTLVGPRGEWRHVAGLWRVWRGLTGDIRADRPDIYHGLSNELPIDIDRAGVPSVVTIHDAIFRREPDNYKPLDRKIYDLKWRSAINKATRIIAISECTRRDIVELYGADERKIDVVYQGCDPQFAEPVSDADRERVRRAYHLPERYIACVGTIEPRKNQALAVRALSALPQDVALVVVGRRREPYATQVDALARELGVASRVIHLEGVPFADLPAIYSAASLAMYVSRYEGFGLPVIEALSTHTPVIAATGSCLEEAGGPGAIYVAPDDSRAAAEAARRLLDDPDLSRRLATDGAAYVGRFNRDAFRRGIAATYARALER